MTTNMRSRMVCLHNRLGEFIGMVAISRATEDCIGWIDVSGRRFALSSKGAGGVFAVWHYDEIPLHASAAGTR